MSATVDDGQEPDAPAEDGGRRPRRWRWPWLQSVAALLVVAGACVYLYPQVASWFSQREQSREIAAAEALANRPPQNDPDFRVAELAKAKAYNDALASGARLDANKNVPTGSGSSSDDSLDYDKLLATGTDGFMGRLRYAALDIDLPIYHGTADDTLLKGVGHLEGTSLPVGGLGNRPVLTGHRGLATATMFTNLNKAKVGDTFVIGVLGEALTYKVIDYRVIDPDQTQTLEPVAGKDLVTLVTCTPLGINTQRILVTGERVKPTPADDVKAVTAPPDLPGFPWWIVILSGVLVVAVGYIVWSGFPRRAPTRKPEDTTADPAAA